MSVWYMARVLLLDLGVLLVERWGLECQGFRGSGLRA